LTSKRSNKDESREDQTQEKEDNQPQKKVVSVNSLESPEKRQEAIEIEDGKVVEVWAVADPVLQFLEKLSPEERSCQIFAIKEEEPPILRKMGDKQLNVQVKLSMTDTHRTFCKQALVDSESSTSCISWKFIKENLINTRQLLFPITCYNADSSTNKDGSVTEVVEINMTIGDHQELIQLSVTNLRNHDLFLGYDWLQKHNLTINWKDSSMNLQNCWQ